MRFYGAIDAPEACDVGRAPTSDPTRLTIASLAWPSGHRTMLAKQPGRVHPSEEIRIGGDRIFDENPASVVLLDLWHEPYGIRGR